MFIKQELSKEDFTSIISNLMQDDALDPNLTPKKSFFTAKLRCNHQQQVQELKIAEVIKLLNQKTVKIQELLIILA